MIGRDHEIPRVLALVEDAQHRLITVTGRGGVGKSSLAFHVARTVSTSGDYAVTVVPLAAVVDPHSVLDEIADVLGVRSSDRAPLDVLERRLHGVPTLLVLDNAEHVVEAGPAVNELVGRCPDLTVVVTSQTRLRVAGEQVVRLNPLPLPGGDIVDPVLLATSPAVELYVTRAASVSDRPGEDVTTIAVLCGRLEGLPLAIELAAARADTLGPTEVLALLEDAPLDVLRQGPATRRRDTTISGPRSRGRMRCSRPTSRPCSGTCRSCRTRSTSTRSSRCTGISGRPTCWMPSPSSSTFTSSTRSPTAGSRCRRRSEPSRAESSTPRQGTRPWVGSSVGVGDARRVSAQGQSRCCAARSVLRSRPDASARRTSWSTPSAHIGSGPACAATTQASSRQCWPCAPPASPRPCEPGRCSGRPVWPRAAATSADREQVAQRIAEAERVACVEGDDELLLRSFAARIVATAALGPVDDLAAFVGNARAVAERAGDRRWRARCDLWAGIDAQLRGDLYASAEHGRAALRAAREDRDDRTLAHAAMLLAPIRELVPGLAAEVPTLVEVLAVARRAGLVDLEGFLLPMLVDDAVHAGDVCGAQQWCSEGLELATESPASVVAVVNLVGAMYVASAAGDDAFAARLHGAIQDSVAGLRSTLQPQRAERYDDTLARLRASLGSRFDENTRAGAALSWGEALDEALSFVGRHRLPASPPLCAPTTRLTPREHDVLQFLAAGMTNKEIGVRLQLRPKTVMHHTGAIYRKLGVRGRAEAAVWSIHNDAAAG